MSKKAFNSMGARGLGDDTFQGTSITPSNISACSSGWYWLLSGCWGMSQTAWQEAGSYAVPSIALGAPAAVPAGSTTVNPSVEDAQAQIDAAIAQAATDYQSNIAASAESLSMVPASACSIALFGETTCWGPFGETTVLVGAAVLGLLLFFMGGKR